MLEKDIANIEEVLYAIKHIDDYIGNIQTKEELLEASMVYDAVMMNFIVLGEACHRLSEEIKSKNPQIDWIGINGFRNFVAHDYLGVDEKIAWRAIKEKLPELKKEFEKILRDSA